MVQLLILELATQNSTHEHCFGGLPTIPAGTDFDWPCCKTCSGPMQFLGRLRIPGIEKNVLMFMCQNNPGLCDEWDAELGGNCAIVLPAKEFAEVQAPREGVTVLETRYAAREASFAGDEYESAREACAKEKGVSPRDVLGQLMGNPSWIQGDETPMCNNCGNRMRFIAQLEEGPDYKTAMNFGGGCAYVFDCSCRGHLAKFLWQC